MTLIGAEHVQEALELRDHVAAMTPSPSNTLLAAQLSRELQMEAISGQAASPFEIHQQKLRSQQILSGLEQRAALLLAGQTVDLLHMRRRARTEFDPLHDFEYREPPLGLAEVEGSQQSTGQYYEGRRFEGNNFEMHPDLMRESSQDMDLEVVAAAFALSRHSPALANSRKISSQSANTPPRSPLERRDTLSPGQKRRGNVDRATRPNFSTNVQSNLKKWLFENLAHAYPSDAIKTQLAIENDMTVVQINNWFVNARRRYLPKGGARKGRVDS